MFGMLVSAALGIPYVASEWQSLADWATTPGYSNPRESGEAFGVAARLRAKAAALLNGDYSQPRLQTQSNFVPNQQAPQNTSQPSWFRTISDTNSTTVEDTAQDAIRAREELGRDVLERARAAAAPNQPGSPARQISNSTPTKEASNGSATVFSSR